MHMTTISVLSNDQTCTSLAVAVAANLLLLTMMMMYLMTYCRCVVMSPCFLEYLISCGNFAASKMAGECVENPLSHGDRLVNAVKIMIHSKFTLSV